MGKLQLDQSKAIIKKYFLAVFSTARASLVQIPSLNPFEKNLCVNCQFKVQRNMIVYWQTYRNPAFFTNESINFYVRKSGDFVKL